MAISVAVGNRLETRHLLSGRVLIEGMDVELVDVGPAPAPIFPAMVTTRPYDVGELTVGNFIIAKDQGVGLVGLPVFPNLFFPLTGVTVNKGAGVAKPEDLAGKRVGVPLGFASNPAVWLRAILASQYGVAADSITWVEGENDSLRDIPYPRPERLKREQMTGLDERLAMQAISTRWSSRAGTRRSPIRSSCWSPTLTRSWRAITPRRAFSPSTRCS